MVAHRWKFLILIGCCLFVFIANSLVHHSKQSCNAAAASQLWSPMRIYQCGVYSNREQEFSEEIEVLKLQLSESAAQLKVALDKNEKVKTKAMDQCSNKEQEFSEEIEVLKLQLSELTTKLKVALDKNEKVKTKAMDQCSNKEQDLSKEIGALKLQLNESAAKLKVIREGSSTTLNNTTVLFCCGCNAF
jgi:chromosome segregation ATPase